VVSRRVPGGHSGGVPPTGCPRNEPERIWALLVPAGNSPRIPQLRSVFRDSRDAEHENDRVTADGRYEESSLLHVAVRSKIAAQATGGAGEPEHVAITLKEMISGPSTAIRRHPVNLPAAASAVHTDVFFLN
jgi:hypothetical protein